MNQLYLHIILVSSSERITGRYYNLTQLLQKKIVEQFWCVTVQMCWQWTSRIVFGFTGEQSAWTVWKWEHMNLIA